MANRLPDGGYASPVSRPAKLRRQFAEQERTAIDAAFAGMADDAEYRAEAELIAREFAQAEWEAFRRWEQQAAGNECGGEASDARF